jgi:histidine triad (HIT) family protein
VTYRDHSGTDFYCEVALPHPEELDVVFEDDRVLAYHHTKPFWPKHIVVVPKRHLSSLTTVVAEDESDIRALFAAVQRVAHEVETTEGAAGVLTNLGNLPGLEAPPHPAIELGGGRLGAVEVTAAENETLAATQGAISKQPILRCPDLRFGWFVLVAPGGNVNLVRQQLPAILRRLEEHGISSIDDYAWDEEVEWASELIRSGHLQAAAVSLSLDPGVVGITGPMRVEWLSMNPDDVVTFAERFVARRPSDVAKLAASGADERHLFIWSGLFSEGLVELRALGSDIESLPQRAPNLPDAITHLWIANEGSRPSRIVHWDPRTGWVEVGRISDLA